MKPIKIKSTGVGIVSAFFCLVGACSCCAAKDRNAQTASFILGFSSAATGIVCVNKSRMDEREVNEKLDKLVSRFSSEKEQVDRKLVATLKDNNRLQIATSALRSEFDLLEGKLKKVELERDSLRCSLNNCHEEIKQKQRAIINIESSKDERFQDYLREFLIRLGDRLFDQCNNYYPRIERELRGLLQDDDFENIHPQLQTFLDRCLEQCQYHLELIGELKSFDVSHVKTVLDASLAGQELMRQYQQIVDEISSLRVRYRNLLNLDERLALKDWEDMKPYLMKKPDALKALREQANFDKEILDQLRARVEEQGKSISEDMRAMLYDLEKAHERVADLSKPIMWQIAPNQTTQTGNAIIAYAKTRGIHLDRSHYEGDVYSADLYFFHDRINPTATVDIKALSEDATKIAQNMHLLEPVKFSYDYELRLMVAHIEMQYRKATSKKKLDPIAKVHEFRKPSEALITFIQEASHVGLWGQTKAGKTTAISNIVGGMIRELGGTPTMRLTIPKIEADTQKLFPEAHWLGVDESIFGLLEAALEIQYRLEKNKLAYRAKEIIQDFEPVLYFIDEINLIFRRWRSICEADLFDVLDRFERTLTGDRLTYFRETMRIELANYKGQFASRLLLFIWQTGRSLKVKSLIAGQNLMPAAFGFHKTDLENCSYIIMGRAIKKGMEYKVDDVDLETISSQHNTLKQAVKFESNLQYTALYCPAVGESYFGILPPPNYYQWDANAITTSAAPAVDPVTTQRSSENAETLAKHSGSRALGENLIQNGGQLPLQPNHDNSPKLFNSRALLPEKYQNLDYRGYSDLLASLPKKGDGRVNKKLAYETVFKVWKADLRRVYSAFIDWLEANFK